MHRDVILACLPWIGCLAVSVAALAVFAQLSGARLRPRRLLLLAGDQVGSVQSLSFVVTLPIFLMVVMFVVQVSQLAIGTIIVHYAAYAAARAAIVIIPADVPEERLGTEPDSENQISTGFERDVTGGPERKVNANAFSPKVEKIRLAAALACMAASPSKGGGQHDSASAKLSDALELSEEAVLEYYRAVSPAAFHNARVSDRLLNKLRYSLANTYVEISFVHLGIEPELRKQDVPPDNEEFRANEVGWQDPISVKVTHNFALLPGPGRLLARRAGPLTLRDTVAEKVHSQGFVYAYPITATATLGNEGERSVIRYDLSVTP